MRTSDTPGVIARPPLIFAAALATVLVLRWAWPMPLPISADARWVGLVLIVLGVGIVIPGRRALQVAGTNVDPMRPTTTIVASGPYRFTRNPLYVGVTLVYCGVGVAVNTWWAAVMLIPLLAIIHFGVVMREERYLEQKFGDVYRRYCAQVRRYL